MLNPEFQIPVLIISLISTLVAIVFFFKYKKSVKVQGDQVEQLHELQKQSVLAEEKLSQLTASLASVESKNKELYEDLESLLVIKGHYSSLQEQETELNSQVKRYQSIIEQLNQQVTQLEKTKASLEKQLENEQQNSAEKIEMLENAKLQMSAEFSNLANKIFEQKQQQFSQSSQATIEATLKPMQGVLNEFKQRVELVHKEDIEGRASLSEQLKQLQRLNSQMTEEAHNLTQALKGDNKTQGNWGELILERLLERSGLTEGIEFEREKSFTDNQGKRYRPDVIINMPDNKHVIIDSKVSLSDYEHALNAENGIDKVRATKAHLNSLKKHITALSEKRYDHIDQLNAPDFVLMFVPVEGAYLMAIESDSRVFEDAFERKIAVVTPTTLFTTLKTIEQLWRYERQSENTVKLIKRAAEVHDKFVGFIDTFEKVGSQFSTAHNSYKKARNQLIEGQGNLVRQAEMLKDLAGKTKKEIPAHLLEEAGGSKLESKE